MDVKIFKPKILSILEASDIDTVSAKRVRKQLQAETGLDFSECKAEIDAFIALCFESLTQETKPETKPRIDEDVKPKVKKEAKPKERSKRKVEEQDESEAYARELQAALNSTRSSRSAGTKPKPKKRKRKETDNGVEKAKRVPANTGFNKLLTLSSELSDLLGEQYLSRPQVSKRVWAYIKEHNLQDSADKRYITCDSKLAGLLSTPRVHMFTMTKLLQKHMIDDGTAPKMEIEDVKDEIKDEIEDEIKDES